MTIVLAILALAALACVILNLATKRVPLEAALLLLAIWAAVVALLQVFPGK